MSNETKRDVFEGLLTSYMYSQDNIIDEISTDGVADRLNLGNTIASTRDRYAAALPDDLPVIPEAVEEFIRTERQNGTSLAIVFHDAAELNRVRYQGWKIWQHADEMLWAYDHQDAFALAWLLGEWEVEDEPA